MTKKEPSTRTARKTPYASMNVTVPARDTLQQQVFVLTGELKRRVSLSEVVLAAAILTERYPEEFRAIVAGETDQEQVKEQESEQ